MKKLNLLFILIAIYTNTQSETFRVPAGSKEIEPELIAKTRWPKTKNPYPLISYKKGTSLNWSGYIAVTNLNHPAKNSVSEVSGSWIVPTITKANHHTYCSIWVGIDGYASPTVEQIGTEHDWNNGKQSHYAWFETYPNYAYAINNFPVHPGDSISAQVVYSGNNVFTMTIVNHTRNIHTVIPTKHTTVANAQRSSAEWVVEAPYSNGILPLSHFGTAYLTKCLAVINGHQGAIGDAKWVHDSIRMILPNSSPKAVPHNLSSNGQDFSVTWAHE